MAPDAPSWDFVRPIASSRHLVATARAHGIDEAAVLQGTGLTSEQLRVPGVEVLAKQELALVRNLLRLADDTTGLGIETGLRYDLVSTGILGYALLTSPTVRDALYVGTRFLTLSSAFVNIKVREAASGLLMEFDTAEIPDDVRDFLLDRDIAAIVSVAPVLVSTSLPDVAVRIELQTTSFPPELFTAVSPSIVVEQGGSRNALTIPAELLDRPMPAADPGTSASCIRQCEDLLDRRRRLSGLSADIRVRLLESPADMPSMAALAAAMAMTVRTLHRKLSAEGTSYRALVEEVRETLAEELLDSGLTVEEVARRLGYSEAAAFTHAFTRWRGHPPSRLKR